jgi:predicted nucleic acid-binding protein
VRRDHERCVVDASAILPLVGFERFSPRAEQWFATVREHAEDSLTVDLFDAECANALWKRVRRELWSTRRAEQALRQILDLPFRRVPVGVVVGDAFTLAATTGLTVYDACYVALAVASGLPMVTADRRLAGVAREAGCDVLCLSEEATTQ